MVKMSDYDYSVQEINKILSRFHNKQIEDYCKDAIMKMSRIEDLEIQKRDGIIYGRYYNPNTNWSLIIDVSDMVPPDPPLPANRQITGILFPSFVTYTDDMYLGNVLADKGGKYLKKDGSIIDSDRWDCKYGKGESVDGHICMASVNISKKINIFIYDDSLWIYDIRHDGKSDIWEFRNDKNIEETAYKHKLESDKIERILNTKFPNCKFWDMVQSRAKELYKRSI